MEIYYIIFSIVILLYYIANKSNKTNIKITFIVISALILIIFTGIRYGVGTDYFNYIDIYSINSKINFINFIKESFEIITFIISKIAYMLNPNDFKMFFMIYSILTIGFIYIGLSKIETKYQTLGLCVFIFLFYPFTLNGMRQGLALAFIFNALLELMYKKNKKKFILYIILASFTHITAIIMLPLVFFDLNKNNYILLYILMGLLIISLKNIVNVDNLGRYILYFSKKGISELGVGVLFKKLPLILIYLIFSKVLCKKNKNTMIFLKFMIIDLFLSYLGYINISLNRFALYFSIIKICSIPNLLNIIRDKDRKFISIIILIIINIIFYYNTKILGINEIIPYRIIGG